MVHFRVRVEDENAQDVDIEDLVHLRYGDVWLLLSRSANVSTRGPSSAVQATFSYSKNRRKRPLP